MSDVWALSRSGGCVVEDLTDIPVFNLCRRHHDLDNKKVTQSELAAATEATMAAMTLVQHGQTIFDLCGNLAAPAVDKSSLLLVRLGLFLN